MIAFLIDADNLSSPTWIDEAFQQLESSGEPISVRRAYGSAENLKGLASVLLAHAIRPFVNLSLPKNTTDLALAVDAMELCCQTPCPTTVVIGSGDADFLPLVVRLRERGIRMVCLSQRRKMSPDAVRWYDHVILVGSDSIALESVLPGLPVAEPNSNVGIPVEKITVKSPGAKKTPAKKAVAKKVATKKAASATKEKASASAAKVEVRDILRAVPTLNNGEFLSLGDVVKSLHDAKLLGKNSTSTKLFKKFPHHFELLPAKQPNKVKYILPPG